MNIKLEINHEHSTEKKPLQSKMEIKIIKNHGKRNIKLHHILIFFNFGITTRCRCPIKYIISCQKNEAPI